MLLPALATLAGAALQSATGFGFALLAAPALLAAFGPRQAIGTVLALSIAMNVLVLGGERRRPQLVGRPLRLLVLWALPGLLGGALLLAAVSRAPLQVATGVAVLAAAAVAAHPAVRAGREAARATPIATFATPVMGLVTGALTTATGVNGPPIVLWLQRRARTPVHVRDSLAAAFLALNVAGTLAVAALGGGGHPVRADTLLVLLPLVIVGHAVGRCVFERLDQERFRAAGLALVAAAGVGSAVAGLTAW